MNVGDFVPDGAKSWTASESEYELVGFKFVGPGWYVGKCGVILVVPDSDVEYVGSCMDDLGNGPWRQSWSPDQKFLFLVYNNRNPVNAFNAINFAPTKLATRVA